MLCWVFRFNFFTTIPSDINGYQGYPLKRKPDLCEDSQSFSGVGPRIVALPLFIPSAPKNSHQGMRCGASLASFTKSRPRPWFHWHFHRRSMGSPWIWQLGTNHPETFRHLRIQSSSPGRWNSGYLKVTQIFAGGKAFKNLSASVTLFFFLVSWLMDDPQLFSAIDIQILYSNLQICEWFRPAMTCSKR